MDAFSKSSAAKKTPLQFVSIVLALALVFSIVTCAPFAVSAAEADGLAAVAAEPEELFGELSGGKYTLESSTYVLTADYALEGYIYVPSDVEATIDLNGHTINRGLSGSAATDYFIKNDGKLMITDNRGNNNGKLTGGYADRGGVVYNNGTLTIERGSFVNNQAKYDAGAVYNADNAVLNVNGGKLTLVSGTISGNSAKYGGGYYFDDSRLEAELSGVTISNNTATEKGGGIYIWHGTVTVEESTLSGNSAKIGGAVYNTSKCTFTATDTTFSKNKSTDNVGAVYNSGKATITDCTFTKNKAKNGTGGAIKQYDGEMALIGGSFTNNMATARGSGIFVDEESDNEKFSIEGNIRITGNTGSDVYLDGEEVIVIADTLSNTAKVGVSLKTISGTFTKGFAALHPDEEPNLYFTADPGYSVIPDDDGEAMVIESDWEILRRQFDKSDSTSKKLKDVTGALYTYSRLADYYFGKTQSEVIGD